ncbi:MAG: hypothetical protein IPJ77_04845 [Planctomycetes bacterium]|nr:hypothetical protein [Planctomycetota bacterium]
MKPRLFLLASLAFVLVPFLRADSPGPNGPAPAPLAKPAIVGASVSAGVGLDPTADAFQGQESKLRLANVVDASIVGGHDAIVDLSSFMFFSAPKPTAKKSAKEVVEAKPSVVVALDYLFWLGFGPGDEKARLERLEDGFKALEPVKAPLLLGDLPDFNGVEVSRMMLSPEAIPSKEVLAKLNARIAEWAKQHANVVVVPIGEMFRKVNAGEEFEVRGNKFGKDARGRIMQQDGLHTTLEGTCALWVLAVDAWLAKKPTGLDEKAFVLDVAQLVAKAPTAMPADASGAAKSGKPSKPSKKKNGVGAGG